MTIRSSSGRSLVSQNYTFKQETTQSSNHFGIQSPNPITQNGIIASFCLPVSKANSKDRATNDASLRLNDGAVDSHGHFFAGACNDPKSASPGDEGILFRLDPDLSLHRVLGGLALPNGIGWNVNEDTMYLTETLSRNIYAFDYSPPTGTMSNQRVFFHLNPEEGGPDGLAVDAEDHVWSAIYGGGKILRISPKGEVVGVVRLPTRCVTCAAFVGEEFFVTSGVDPYPKSNDFPRSAELGGSVFRTNVGVNGRRINRWKQLDLGHEGKECTDLGP
jgi:sugar lactone lactonase YvrE